MFDYKNNIKTIELGLLNNCILKCPMCLRQESKDIGINVPKGFTQLEPLIKTLDYFTNIDRVDLVGSVGEPTLYPNLFELLEYLNSRNIRIILSTNGATKIDWVSLGLLMKQNDIIRFAVDGSTQELHSKYRVGSKLDKVLENHRIFKENSKAITIAQNIIFKYNENDKDNIKKICKDFNYIEYTHTGDTIFIHDEIRAVDNLMVRYNELNNYVNRTPFANIECLCHKLNQLYINHSGHILPCDDLEELAFTTFTKNIYNSSTEDLLEIVDKLVKKSKMTTTCIRCCGACNNKIREDYPVTQYNAELGKEIILENYRLTIKDNKKTTGFKND